MTEYLKPTEPFTDYPKGLEWALWLINWRIDYANNVNKLDSGMRYNPAYLAALDDIKIELEGALS